MPPLRGLSRTTASALRLPASCWQNRLKGIFRERAVILPNGRDQAGDVMLLASTSTFDPCSRAVAEVIGPMLPTFIPSPGRGKFKREEILYRRRAGESDQVGSFLTKARLRAPVTSRVPGPRSVPQTLHRQSRPCSTRLVGEQVPRPLCASDQNAQVFSPAGFLEFLHDPFRNKTPAAASSTCR